MMFKSLCFKYIVFVACLFVSQLGNASVELIAPIVNIPHGPIIRVEPQIPEPIETLKSYSLKIDENRSFFRVEKNPSSYGIMGFNFSEPAELSDYPIAGTITLLERYKRTVSYSLDETKLTSIDFESNIKNIDLSSTEFWNDAFSLEYSFIDHFPGNWICACITSSSFSIGEAFIKGEFDGEFLELNGGGIFKEDANDGVLRLEPSFDATHKITYHIEAAVVSAVPVPAAIYFFFTALGGLAFVKSRNKR